MSPASKNAITVLLVEDDDVDYELTTAVLADVCGVDYDVSRCTTLEQVRELGDGLDLFDVCLVGFCLIRDVGIDLLKFLAGAAPSLPCIVLTGQADRNLDRQAMELGAADYLVKGELKAEEIERSVRYAIGSASAVASLRVSEARFRSVVESATDGIVLLDHRGIVVAANQAAIRLAGRSDDNMVGHSCMDFLSDESVVRLSKAFDLERTDGRWIRHPGAPLSSKPVDAQLIQQSGGSVAVELTVSSWVSMEQRFWSVIIRDVTERRAMSRQLEHQAFHDPLTGLANRTLLKEKLNLRLRSTDVEGEMTGLIFLDLDNFKLVNDTFGHEVGDVLLNAVAQRLVDNVRSTDLVARLGGDEFAVFLHSIRSAAAAQEIAQRLIDSLSDPIELAGLPLVASGSAGVALAQPGEISADDLIRNADVAMYSAKASGKNRMAFFKQSMHDASLGRMSLEQDLRVALETDGIGIAYQPIVELRTGAISGFEALARWTHPVRGVISPDVFIAIAEKAGMIERLGRSVMERAVNDVATLQRQLEKSFNVNVNLSTRQLDDSMLVYNTRRLLMDSGIRPGSLTLEVTESVMVGHVDRAIAVLNELRDLDVKLALDDFGTGYSSLSYLHMLPLDSLKADRSFVARHSDQAGRSLLRAVVMIAESLGLKTVAEGIEDAAEESAVRALGYDYGQGFLFSRPLGLDGLRELLEAQSVRL